MEKTMHILFGFEETTSISNILKIIRGKGYEVKYASRVTKDSISAYLSEHPDCEHAVLRESTGSEMFSIYDFTELTDLRDINIVAIIDRAHKGTEFMHSLYAAGIVSAIYSDGKKGAQPAAIAQLLMEKRTRKKTRGYYGIDMAPMRLDILTYETFTSCYTKLMDDATGINMVDRYISIVNELSVRQAADFTMRIPAELRKKLSEYEEFFFVMDAMKRQGVQVQIQRPAHLKRALTDEQFAKAIKSEGKKKVKPKKSNLNKSKKAEQDNSIEKKEGESVTFENVDNVFWNEETVGETMVVMETGKEDSVQEEAVMEEKTAVVEKTSKEDVIIITDDSEQIAFKKKPKAKVKWNYVLYTFVVGVLLIVFWYFLMVLMQVY